MARKKSIHYVDNTLFYQLMVDYTVKCTEATADDRPIPIIPNSIASKIIKIAKYLAFRPNFINYTYRDDMIGDAIENCIKYCHKFDPGKTKNPFSYFTQICFYAFLRRIDKEKRQHALKAAIIQRSGTNFISLDTTEATEDQFIGEFMDTIRGLYDVNVDEIFNRKKNKVKVRAAKKQAEESADNLSTPSNLESFT